VMQIVLDQCLVEHNTKRPCQGRGVNGRTPIVAFRGIAKEDTPDRNRNRKAESRLTHAHHGDPGQPITTLCTP
jgi:hypothetical protein